MWGGVHFQKSCLKKALSRRTCLFISSPPLVHTCTHIHKAVVKTKTICYPPASNSFTDFPHSFSAVIAAKVFWHFCMAVTPARRGKKKKNPAFPFHRSHVSGGFRRAQLLLLWQDKSAPFTFLQEERPPWADSDVCFQEEVDFWVCFSSNWVRGGNFQKEGAIAESEIYIYNSYI